MESTITSCGFSFFISLKIICVLVSVRRKNLSLFIRSLSARILICCSLSSPLIYKVTIFFSCKVACRKSVDFPMPGSPAIKTILPKTIPPPSTRLSSLSSVIILFSSPLVTSCKEIVFTPPLNPENSFHSDSCFSFPFTITSSTKVFHSLHDGHLPTHFVLSCPQLLQKNAVFLLLI